MSNKKRKEELELTYEGLAAQLQKLMKTIQYNIDSQDICNLYTEPKKHQIQNEGRAKNLENATKELDSLFEKLKNHFPTRPDPETYQRPRTSDGLPFGPKNIEHVDHNIFTSLMAIHAIAIERVKKLEERTEALEIPDEAPEFKPLKNVKACLYAIEMVSRQILQEVDKRPIPEKPRPKNR